MGLLEAVGGFVGDGRLARRPDYLTVPANIAPTAALFPAVPAGQSVDRDKTIGHGLATVVDGSKIVVPEGYGLLLSENGKLTAFVDEPGAYLWYADDVGSQTYIFGGQLSSSSIRHSWEHFHSDVRPRGQQVATFVRLKELPFNRFGTQSTVYWDDTYLNAQVGAIAHGTYSLKIVDPIKFAMQFVPVTFMQNQSVFDFSDWGNPAANQMFYEVVGSLSAALSRYANGNDRGNRISKLQQGSIGFAESLSEVVQEAYSWEASRGIVISKVSIIGIEYDTQTTELLREVQRLDALGHGQERVRLPSFRTDRMPPQSVIDTNGPVRGELDGRSASVDSAPPMSGAKDLITVLGDLAKALEAGFISKSEHDAARSKALGL